MCDVDVLDLSVRCQSQQLPPPHVDNINNWTASTTLLTQVNASPAWLNSSVSRGMGKYELEPISPSSSPDHQPPTYLARRDLDVFYPQHHVDTTSQQSPTAAARWSTEAPVVTTSPTQTMSSVPRRWNGDSGHPYSPLKRVLHQYRNGVAPQENASSESNTGSSGGGTSSATEINPPPPSSTTTVTAPSAYRKPTTTTTAMSFEQFVLGMLSKVGGGKAITAATQSYLRETAAVASNRVNGTSTGIDCAAQSQGEPVQRQRYDERSPFQTAEQRKELERQMLATTIHREGYSPPSYHPGSVGVTAGGHELQYPPSRPSSDLRMMVPPLPGTVRRSLPPPRADERDDAYRERRRKNNEAAKRSRDTRRLKELQVAAQAERLAEENLQLKAEIAVLRSQLGYLHRMMLDNNNGSSVNNGGGTDEVRQDDSHNSTHQYAPEDGGRTV